MKTYIITLLVVLIMGNFSYSQVGKSPFKSVKNTGSTLTTDTTANSKDVVDVDQNIPAVTEVNENRYALIIGNEDYASFQRGLNTESNVLFARNDARIFSQYAEKALGVPKNNILLLLDAKSYEMTRAIDKLQKYADIAKGKGEIIVYYSGHGYPEEKTKEGYIIPVDISGTEAQNGIKLNDLYEKLGALQVKSVVVFIDACFSGGGRSQGLLVAKAVKMKPKPTTLTGKLVVFSACSGEQVSLFYKDKRHGMFTYWMLKKLQETKGDFSLGKFADYITPIVRKTSLDINNKDQSPEVSAGADATGWENWKL